MSKTLSERYSDAVARIHARRRLKISTTTNNNLNYILKHNSNITSDNVDNNNKKKKNGEITNNNKEDQTFKIVAFEIGMGNISENPQPSKYNDKDNNNKTSPVIKSPLEFPNNNNINNIIHNDGDIELANTIRQHQELLSLITSGSEMLVKVSPLNEEEDVDNDNNGSKESLKINQLLQNTAVRASVYCTPDLRTLVWEKIEIPGVNSIPISEIAAIVCIYANDLDNTFLPKEAPILRVMIRGESNAYDFVCSDIDVRLAWARGLSLAYGMQTCPILSESLR